MISEEDKPGFLKKYKTPLVILCILWIAVNVPWKILSIDSVDKRFMDGLSEKLQTRGDTVLVENIVSDDWKTVCVVLEQTVSSSAASALKIDAKDVVFSEGEDFYANERVWGYSFLYPPNKVKFFRVNGFRYTPHQFAGCYKREDMPELELVPVDFSADFLKIVI